MSRSLLSCLAACLPLTLTAAVGAEEPLAINYVGVTPRLDTSGQPSQAALETLPELGIDIVINLAPPTSRDAVATEGKLVSASGITYVNIPVDWQNPTERDFDLFSGIMQSAGDRHVLVHCQANMRASVFTFLYRVVHEHVPPDEAFEAVRKVWIPRDQWATFGERVLEDNGVAFRFPAAAAQ
jgi:protein tyrosine phosphatase (PTP) superfamily phosphohydrolase (DUF442 family)